MLDQRLRPTMPYAALVFDCDGTLVDTASANETAWRAALADWEVELDPAWYRARTGLSGDRLLAELETETGAELDYPAVRAAALDAYQWLIHTVTPHRPVAAVAEAHRGRVPMAVASGGARHAVEETLRATGLRPLFDAVVTRDDVRYGKPAPRRLPAGGPAPGRRPARLRRLRGHRRGGGRRARRGDGGHRRPPLAPGRNAGRNMSDRQAQSKIV